MKKVTFCIPKRDLVLGGVSFKKGVAHGLTGAVLENLSDFDFESENEFEDGDFMAGTCGGNTLISIFKGKTYRGCMTTYANVYADGDCLSTEESDVSYDWAQRLATPDERLFLISELEKAGKRWNGEKKRVESIEAEFKDGDFVALYWNNGTIILCLKEILGRHSNGVSAYFGIDAGGRFAIDNFYGFGYDITMRKCTFAESVDLLLKLIELGKKWNPELKKVEDIKYQPKEGISV